MAERYDTYQLGWMGLKSQPITCDSGWELAEMLAAGTLAYQEKWQKTYSAKSIAQIPVPVPISKTSEGLSIGARASFPAKARRKTW